MIAFHALLGETDMPNYLAVMGPNSKHDVPTASWKVNPATFTSSVGYT